MHLMSTQLNNEYAFAKQHTVLTLRDGLEDDMGSYVRQYVSNLIKYFSETDFTYMVGDEQRVWATKQTRYTDMQALSITQMEDLAWTIICQIVTKKLSTFTEVIGKFYKKLPHQDRLGLETAAEMLGVLNDSPFITVIYPRYSETGVMMIQSNVDLDAELTAYVKNQRFILPSLVVPKTVACNTDTGYQTISGSVILSGKHNDKKVNLAHLNRQNKIALCMDERVPRLVEPVFKEKLESADERVKRYKAWVKLNTACIEIFAKFVGVRFYLTHKFDERQRTYDVGHEFNSMGDDYRKAIIELDDVELVEC
jgi:hypothetical protein